MDNVKRGIIYVLGMVSAIVSFALSFLGITPTPVNPFVAYEIGELPEEPGVLTVDLNACSPSDLDFIAATGDVDERYDTSCIVQIRVDDLHAAKDYIDNFYPDAIYEQEMMYEITGTLPEAPNDPGYVDQWHMKAIDVPFAWATTPNGEGVVVAVIDTGVAIGPDLKGTKILEGKSFVSSEPDSVDQNGHGTHCAGTIAQTTNNEFGVTGVAPDATVLPVKVLSASGSGSNAGVTAGIDWAVQQDVDVISMSLGGPAPSAAMGAAIARAIEKGIIVIAAAGNDSSRGVGFPAGYPDVIGVSATGPTGKPSFYTNYGEVVDVAGPGGDKNFAKGGVFQETINRRGGGGSGFSVQEFQGTSMATPHVAGMAATLLSTGASPKDVTEALLKSGGLTEWDPYYGWGLVNMKTALQSLGHSGGTSMSKIYFSLVLGAMTLIPMKNISYVWRAATLMTMFFVGTGTGVLAELIAQVLEYLGVGGAAPVREFLSLSFLDLPLMLKLQPSIPPFVHTLFQSPLWFSFALPAAATFLLVGMRRLRWAVGGFAAGVGMDLIYRAITGFDLAYVPFNLDGAWLMVNGVGAMICALMVFGLQRHEERK